MLAVVLPTSTAVFTSLSSPLSSIPPLQNCILSGRLAVDGSEGSLFAPPHYGRGNVGANIGGRGG